MSQAGTYTLTSKKLHAGGQQLQVRDALAECGKPSTVREVAEQLSKNPHFKTRQTTERIAAYYICVMKKSGHVTQVSTFESEEVGELDEMVGVEG